MRQDPRTQAGSFAFQAWRKTLAHPGPETAPVARRPRRRPEATSVDAQQGLYIISVAARLLEMHPQTLRKYERIGLVRPSRTIGMLRLYSEEDLAQLRAIKYLVENLRLNLAGVELIMDMVRQLNTVRQRLAPSRGTFPAQLPKGLKQFLEIFWAR